MQLPPLLVLPGQAHYRDYYNDNYVKAKVFTFDGIEVKFFPNRFYDAFFESESRRERDKSRFSEERAKRMNWIGTVLNDAKMELYRRIEDERVYRIALHSQESYAVIIIFTDRDPTVAKFVTAYTVDNPKSLEKMRSNPKW